MPQAAEQAVRETLQHAEAAVEVLQEPEAVKLQVPEEAVVKPVAE